MHRHDGQVRWTWNARSGGDNRALRFNARHPSPVQGTVNKGRATPDTALVQCDGNRYVSEIGGQTE
jgi:hypothetical protein